MIAVLADDITGAAEIAGIGLRFDLNVRFDLAGRLQEIPSADVWVIASDTRSLPEKEACALVRKIARFLRDNKLECVFKKIDSSLRGHIVAEVESLRKFIPKKQVFILPANPEIGRVIRDGFYYIDGLPLHETSFANDPDFPAKSASVNEILKSDAKKGRDFILPDISTEADYREYARQIHPNSLPVGGSVFFEAWLQVCFPSAKPDTQSPKSVALGDNQLMICGSTHETSRRFVRENKLFPVLAVPCTCTEKSNTCAAYLKSIFDMRKKLLITVENDTQSPVSPVQVKNLLTKMTRSIMENCQVAEIFVEGGATAYALIRACNFASLIPIEEYARGVVRLKIPDRENLYITIKPGSYEWPENLFQR